MSNINKNNPRKTKKHSLYTLTLKRIKSWKKDNFYPSIEAIIFKSLHHLINFKYKIWKKKSNHKTKRSYRLQLIRRLYLTVICLDMQTIKYFIIFLHKPNKGWSLPLLLYNSLCQTQH